MPIDLSKVTREELMTIHNEVLRNLALETKAKIAEPLSVAHDSHGSNHSNNKITDMPSQISEILRRQ